MNNIRIQFKVSECKTKKNLVKLTLESSDTNDNTNNGTVDYARIQRQDDNNHLKGCQDDGGTVGTAGNFRWSSSKSDNPRTGSDATASPSDLRKVKIFCQNSTEAQVVAALISFKDHIKGQDGAAPQWRFWIDNFPYDEDKVFSQDDATTWLNLPTKNHNKLWIKTADLTNGISDIKINNVSFVDKDAKSKDDISPANNFDGVRNEIITLFTKLGNFSSPIQEDLEEKKEVPLPTIDQNDIDFLKEFQNSAASADKKKIYDWPKAKGMIR